MAYSSVITLTLFSKKQTWLRFCLDRCQWGTSWGRIKGIMHFVLVLLNEDSSLSSCVCLLALTSNLFDERVEQKVNKHHTRRRMFASSSSVRQWRYRHRYVRRRIPFEWQCAILPSILPQSAVTLFQSSSSLVVTTSVDDLIAIMTIDWCCYMYKCIEGNTIWLHRGLKLCRNPLVEVLPLRGIVLRSSPASRSMTSKVMCNCHFATQQLIHLVKELAEFSYFVSSKQVFSRQGS